MQARTPQEHEGFSIAFGAKFGPTILISSPMNTASPRTTSTLPVVEQLRIEASRRFANDPELDAIEHELRMDLHGKLSWDSSRDRVQKLLESLDQPPGKPSLPS